MFAVVGLLVLSGCASMPSSSEAAQSALHELFAREWAPPGDWIEAENLVVEWSQTSPSTLRQYIRDHMDDTRCIRLMSSPAFTRVSFGEVLAMGVMMDTDAFQTDGTLSDSERAILVRYIDDAPSSPSCKRRFTPRGD